MDFCELDGSRLMTEFTINGIIKICYKCNNIKEAKHEDTLIVTDYIKKNKSNVMDILKNGGTDNTNASVYNQCSVCDNKIVKMVYIGESMDVYYLCECGNVFK